MYFNQLFFSIPLFDSLVEISKQHSVLQDICKSLSKNLDLPKGSITTSKLYEIVHSSWLNQKEFPMMGNSSETIKKMKSRFSKEIKNLGVDEKEFGKLFQKLKLYANASSFQRRNFILSLIDLVLPIGKTINIFDYGELLCYIPLVRALLTRTQCSKTNHTQTNTETVKIALNRNTTFSSLVTYYKKSMDCQLMVNDKILFHFSNKADFNTFPVEAVEETIGLFEKFIEDNMDKSIVEKIPTISTSIIFQIFRCLHTIEIHLLDEIMLKI